jgi:hypothetical protein
MTAPEHILLESDERKVPHPRCSRKVHARIELRSRLRRRALQLELVDYYYLVVRSYRSGSVAAEYVLDLRFVDSSMGSSRHFALRWLLAAVALVAMAGLIAFRIADSVELTDGSAVAFGIASAGALVACLGFVWRTRETISMYSDHGRAKLFEFTGGFGAKRAVKPFMSKLAAHIRFATAARRPVRSEHLRDEMREHFRLRESGVLSAEEYEASKARILAEHSPATGPGTDREGRAARLAPDMGGGWY